MRLLSIEIEGFKKFSAHTKYTFPDEAGLFFVRGKNKAEPRLGSNGAGKTSFFDAISWCWFGKTARRLTAGDVESWRGVEGCSVRTIVEVGGLAYGITRTRRPIGLAINENAATQDDVDDLLGLSFERFLHVVLMGQFAELFPDLKPAARLQLLSDVLRLEVWIEAAKEAKNEKAKLGLEKGGLSENLAQLEGQFGVIQSQLPRLQEEHDAWDSRRAKSRFEIERRIRRLELRAKRAREHAAEAEKEATALGAAWRQATERVDADREKVARRSGDSAEARAKERAAADALQALRRERAKLEDLGAECPLCQQTVPEEHRDAIVGVSDATIAEAKRTAGELRREASQVRGDVVSLERSAQKTSEEERRARSELSAAASALEAARVAVTEAETEFRLMQEERSRGIRENNPYSEALKVARASEQEIRDNIEAVGVHLFDTEFYLEQVGLWVPEFKEVRLWLVDTALDELTIHTNSSLVELGLIGWSVDYAIERETSTGGVTRGFEIIVRSPESPEGAKWEAYSGGETQRLRLACSLGLANLIRSRMVNPPELEIWDEPTRGLHEEGIQDLLDFFNARADERQVWVIDHHSLAAGVFDGGFTVIRDAEGSRLEEFVA